MKLSVITDEISQDFEHALDVMGEYGVRHAELRGLWDTNIADLDASQVSRAKKAMDARGITVSCLSTPVYKCDLHDDLAAVRGPMHLAKARTMDEQIEVLRRCCAHAHSFGTDLIRVFTFWRQGTMSVEIEDQIVDAFAKPVKVAEEEGVILVLENEHACFVGTGAEAARVISKIDSPRVRACWDPGNAYLAGERPFPDGFEEIRPFLAHVHVKDAVIRQDGTGYDWTVMGRGDIDYTGQFEALGNIGYNGYISLETHYIPQDGTPEQGSRACLAALRELLKD